MKCRHSWEFSHQTPNGEGRVFKYYLCRLCPKTCRRNLKKPRFTGSLPRQAMTPRKQSKTSQKPPVRKRKAIRQVSDKRKKQNAEYSVLRKAFLEEHPVCQVCHSKSSDQIHHCAGREGEWLTNTEFFLAVCGGCHDFIENNRAEAKIRGWLITRKPST